MSKKILLIDDELDILEILSYNLEKEGYDIYTTTNGNEGIEKAEGNCSGSYLIRCHDA